MQGLGLGQAQAEGNGVALSALIWTDNTGNLFPHTDWSIRARGRVLAFAGVAARVALIRIIARRGVAYDHGEGVRKYHRHP